MFFMVCIILLAFPEKATIAAAEGLEVALKTVVVSVLPFSIAASAIIYSGKAAHMVRCITPLLKRIKINPYGIIALFMGFLGGYPTGCKIVCDLYRENRISKSSAEKMLAYVNNGGIMFALNVCGRNFFSSQKGGWIIFIASVMGAVASMLIMGRDEWTAVTEEEYKKRPPGAIWGKSIASGGMVILNVMASFIVMYAVMGAVGLEKMPVISGFFEMTKGVMYAGEIKSLALGALFFSVGGVGVWLQSSALCGEWDISLKHYFGGKIISGVVAFLITYLWTK